MRRSIVNVISFILFLFVPLLSERECQAVDPFDNIPASPGIYFLTYPMYYAADKFVDGKGHTVTDHLDLHLYQNLFRFAYYNKNLLKNTLVFSAILPVGRINLPQETSQGVGDLTLATGYWLIEDSGTKTWLGIVGYLNIPIGDYDSQRTVNMGSNVWKVKPSLIIAKQFGKFDAEFTLKYCISARNENTDVKDGNEANIEGYIGYFLQPNLAIGAHLNAIYGDNKHSHDHVIPDSRTLKYQTGPSINWMANDRMGITFESLFDIEARNSTKGRLFMGRFLWKF